MNPIQVLIWLFTLVKYLLDAIKMVQSKPLKKIPKVGKRKDAAYEDRIGCDRLRFQRRLVLGLLRASINVMTAVAILAVDFKVFPRRFAKTETFGTSLMDVGVGSVVFSYALMAGRLYSGKIIKNSLPSPLSLFRIMKSTIPVLLLGIIRFFVVKTLDYHEHVSEYGVHWNFFITLGLLPLLLHLFINALPFDPLFTGMLTAIIYQAFLSWTSLENYILYSDRISGHFISQNREGIFSLLGKLT
jgi:phosphatidylinositol glycan class W